jgi:hypothetical protein
MLTALVAVLLVWVEWNRRVVRERQALLRLGVGRITSWHLAESNRPSNLYRDHADRVVQAAQRSGAVGMDAKYFPATMGNSLSWLRRRLGDRPYTMIKIAEPQLVPRIRKWFPEAVCILDDGASFQIKPIPDHRRLYPGQT